MSLTLVQLATAIEQGKTIELRYKGVWSVRDHIAEIFGYYRDFPEHVRVKPEPRFWIVDLASRKFIDARSDAVIRDPYAILVKEVL